MYVWNLSIVIILTLNLLHSICIPIFANCFQNRLELSRFFVKVNRGSNGISSSKTPVHLGGRDCELIIATVIILSSLLWLFLVPRHSLTQQVL